MKRVLVLLTLTLTLTACPSHTPGTPKEEQPAATTTQPETPAQPSTPAPTPTPTPPAPAPAPQPEQRGMILTPNPAVTLLSGGDFGNELTVTVNPGYTIWVRWSYKGEYLSSPNGQLISGSGIGLTLRPGMVVEIRPAGTDWAEVARFK